MGGASLAAAAALLLVATDADAGARPPASSSARPPAAQRVHVVARGDTLWELASRYDVTVPAIVAANGLRSDRVVLRLGQRLVIPASSPAPATRPRDDAAARASGDAAPGRRTAGVSRPPATPSRGTAERVVRRAAVKPSPLRRPPTRGPRELELTVPSFVEDAPEFAWPVEGPVSSTYGRRRSGWHRGIDIKADRGSVVFAAAPGIVVAAGWEPRYGRVVKIAHQDEFVTVYAHNEENLVAVGMQVSAGDPIATIGRSGRATAHHLHFEIRRGTAVYNPLYLLPLPPRVGQVDLTEEPDEPHD